MKKIRLVLVLASVIAGGVWAQEPEQEQNQGLWVQVLSKLGFAPGLEGTRLFINGGVGFEIPLTFNIDHNMPPLSASVDYVWPATPFSFGLKAAFSTVEFLGNTIDDCVNIDIALRVAAHSRILESIKNLDISVLVLIGFDFATGDAYKLLKDSSRFVNFDGFYVGFGLGARYFFARNIGAFLEADFKFLQKLSVGASAGLALKF